MEKQSTLEPPSPWLRSLMASLHIKRIRKHKFSIGGEGKNPLTLDLHHAVSSLSAELYTKDVHFLMELIQNAEDNDYPKGVKPTLEFVLTDTDITGKGAPATLLIFNNEVGFSEKNMDSICSVGRSTKKKTNVRGFIGEKGIGFKSVFLVSAWPHIFSNGYQVRFSERPNCDCGIGYIVPEWVDAKPTVSDIHGVYGSHKILPMTTVILPLKPEKVETVKKQLSEMHPEVLLFLSKIKQLSVWENNASFCAATSVSAMSISSETKITNSMDRSADSRIVRLSVKEDEDVTNATCGYYIWRKVFPVNPENRVVTRKDIEKWEISLAFPFGKRLKGRTSLAGVFAFLPTAMVTNFPFIIQSDFILSSSREAILFDNKWNLGILTCVPCAFVDAFLSCINTTESTASFSIQQVLKFLPVHTCSFPELNKVRQSISDRLQREKILPYETFSSEQRVICKPIDAMRILPEFRKLLLCIKEQGVPLGGVSSQGKFVLHSDIDREEYNRVLEFLQVVHVKNRYGWYGRCLQACNFTYRVSVDVYMQLLFFLADNWKVLPFKTIKNIPLLKYSTWNGEVVSCSMAKIKQGFKVHFIWEAQAHAWLSKWNLELGCPNDLFFLSDSTVSALVQHPAKYVLRKWLVSKVGVRITSVHQYISDLGYFVGKKKDAKLVISLAHLLFHASFKSFIPVAEVSKISRSMPVIDGCHNVHVHRTKTLVPASRSKWMKIFGSDNPYIGEYWEDNDETRGTICDVEPFLKYVDLGEVYAEASEFAGDSTANEELLDFLINHTQALDLPKLQPMNVELRVVASQLTSDQAFLLLKWIQRLRIKGTRMPERFIESIQNGKWMKTYSGFNSPNQCFLSDGGETSSLLKKAKSLNVFSIIDQEFYMSRISSYKDELMMIGVRVGSEDMDQLIIDCLNPLASSLMSCEWVIFMLMFIRYLKAKDKIDECFLASLKEGKWLKTNQGNLAPVGTVFLVSEFEPLSQFSDLVVIDKTYYKGHIDSFVEELKLLGVIMDPGAVLGKIPKTFSLPQYLATLTKESVLLMLRCIKHVGSGAVSMTMMIRDKPWMKTRSGFRCPSESVLFDNKWIHLLDVIPVPVIDEAFYGIEIRSFMDELKGLGVAVDLKGVSKMVCGKLKSLGSTYGLTSADVIPLLKCIKYMIGKAPSQVVEFRDCLLGVKWLKTFHGYQSAPDAILSNLEWGPLLGFVDLPFIDVAFYGTAICEYKNELKIMGVIVDFSEGSEIVARCIKLDEEPYMASSCALSLLQCVRSQQTKLYLPMVKDFFDKLKGSKWLRTEMGYKSPEGCLLFDMDWESLLNPKDAPFIDVKFYGSQLSLYKDQLKAIGVKVDAEEVCHVISLILMSHTQTSSITRIYRFLNKFEWYPRSFNKFKWCPRLPNKSYSQLWIPDKCGSSGGKWVDSQVCVHHIRDNLFGSRLYALDKHYERELLPFFSSVFGVAEVPSVDDYVNLWNSWVRGNKLLTAAECSSFWEYILEKWNLNTMKTLKEKMTALPASTLSGEGVQLVDKEELFVPDDNELKRIFWKASGKPLFVWSPGYCLSNLNLSKLHEVYIYLGVRKISESTEIVSSPTEPINAKIEKMYLKNELIGRSLIKIVLAFLSGPWVCMVVEERHKIASTLLELRVFATDKPIMVTYGVQLACKGKRLDIEAQTVVHWEKNTCSLLVHKSNMEDPKDNIEFATCFARAVSEHVLPKNRPDLIDHLCRIIQMCFAFGLEVDAVDFLLTKENLELHLEDLEFLDAVFRAKHSSLVLKRQLQPGPSTPSKKRRLMEQEKSDHSSSNIRILRGIGYKKSNKPHF